jgi:hypothetical protein
MEQMYARPKAPPRIAEAFASPDNSLGRRCCSMLGNSIGRAMRPPVVSRKPSPRTLA